jgi:hypothetical protein
MNPLSEELGVGRIFALVNFVVVGGDFGKIKPRLAVVLWGTLLG